ncbi:hypothetical protein M9H77_35440 [Catharanthus roseus]|uniref:Uncharacterized protein n=1 Tax=Catharanthus roseus TaxID=4058 RepID=A0ACB9ZSP0_CATRO|nr:hypothetical protein M9H77_35440 [Catharanthus roseus]
MSTRDEEPLPNFVFEAQPLLASHASLSKMYENERQIKAHLQHQTIGRARSLKKIFKILVSLQDKMAEEKEGSVSRKKKKMKMSPDHTDSIGSWSSI